MWYEIEEDISRKSVRGNLFQPSYKMPIDWADCL